jgi:hypothetical protein
MKIENAVPHTVGNHWSGLAGRLNGESLNYDARLTWLAGD